MSQTRKFIRLQVNICTRGDKAQPAALWRYVVDNMGAQCQQGRNHVSKVGGPIPWSMVLLPFYRKKIRQVYPVWCSRLHNHSLYSSKSYVKSLGVRPNFAEIRTSRPRQWLRPCQSRSGTSFPDEFFVSITPCTHNPGNTLSYSGYFFTLYTRTR